MPGPFSRRALLRTSAALALAGLFAPYQGRAAESPAGGLALGTAKPFSFKRLIARAEALAAMPYRAPYRPAPNVVEQIDYEAHGKIRFDPRRALFAEGPGAYPATFFHLGRYFQKSVKMHKLDRGLAREIAYSPDYFDMPADSVARQLPADAGFAGFRLQEARNRKDWPTQDWIAFLGASYFRAIGALGQYGLSARGIAVNVAAQVAEEFPDFTEFYIAPAADPDSPVNIFALLHGPSLAGAYHFAIRRSEGVTMEVDKLLFLRRPVERLGIAPLTSMFWFNEASRRYQEDWRPEVHDSDGLALWTGQGERLWRPLNNPQSVVTSSFLDESPRGFGLLQRDRNFENYLDGVHYERRPSLWVEPLGPWGPGAVQLVEIPTDDEIHDNIVAFWVPRDAVKAGDRFQHKYRLHWQADEPYPEETLAKVVATRIGRGGEPGKPRPPGLDKFVVEFAGRPLAGLAGGTGPEARISASRGKISYVFTEAVPGTKRWRAQFDLAASGPEPVELRLYLAAADGTPLSETWLYQHRSLGDPPA